MRVDPRPQRRAYRRFGWAVEYWDGDRHDFAYFRTRRAATRWAKKYPTKLTHVLDTVLRAITVNEPERKRLLHLHSSGNLGDGLEEFVVYPGYAPVPWKLNDFGTLDGTPIVDHARNLRLFTFPQVPHEVPVYGWAALLVEAVYGRKVIGIVTHVSVWIDGVIVMWNSLGGRVFLEEDIAPMFGRGALRMDA